MANRFIGRWSTALVAGLTLAGCGAGKHAQPADQGDAGPITVVSDGGVADGSDTADGWGGNDVIPSATPDVADRLSVEPNHNCPDLFRQELVPTFELDIDPEHLAALEQEFTAWRERQAAGLPLTPFHPVVFRYGAEVVPDAQVRLREPTWAWTGTKWPLVISFNRVHADARFRGLRQLELEAAPFDATLLRHRVALSLLRDLGAPAACANNARLVVNGVDRGVYVNLEALDHEWAVRNFPEAPDGDIWIYGWLPGNDGAPNWDRLSRYAAEQDLSAWGTMADLAQMTLGWAAEAVIPHGNGYWGLGQAHTLYDHPTRGFLHVSMELSASFDWLESTVDPVHWTGFWVEGPPLKYLSLVRDPIGAGRYRQAVARIAGAYDDEVLAARVDRWAAQIAGALRDDLHRPFSMDDHQVALAQLRGYFMMRALFLKAWLRCTEDGGGDGDGDGAPWCADCDDALATRYPGAPEICGNQVDDDCNGRRDDGCSP